MANDVLVAMGNSCVDEYYSIDYVPKQGEKVMSRYLESKVGGMIGNAAAVYAGFNHPTYMFDYMKKNAISDVLVDDLIKHHVDPSCIAFEDHYPNNKAQIMLKDGERIIFVMVDTDTPHILTSNQETVLNQANFLYTTPTDILQLVDYPKHIAKAKQSGLKIFMDVEGSMVHENAQIPEIFALADFISINEQALDKLNQLMDDVITQYKDQAIILLTQGEQGSTIFHKDERIKIQPIPVKIVDTTGAGDTYNASFLHAYQKGWSLKDCGNFATAAASRAIMTLGARSGIASEEEILEFHKKHR